MPDIDLFTPLQLGALTLPNRLVMAPLTRNRASRSGVPGPLQVEYYRQRASAGLIISEATRISPQGIGYPFTPGIWSAEQVAGWRAVTDAAHALLMSFKVWNTATVGGNVKTIRRKYEEFQARAAELDRNIDLFLAEGREDLARAAQSKYNSTMRLVETYAQQLEQMQREYQNLMDARLKLEAKLTTIKQEREELEALLELAKSKEITARTIKSLDDLAGVGDADVARVADSIRKRLDRASAESEMRAASLDRQMDELLERGELDAQLAARKARLGMSKSG